MFKILYHLIAIQRQAKEIHYRAKGFEFYSDHLLADRIYDGIEDLIDEIQENYFLGKEEEAPSQKDLLIYAAEEVNDASGDIRLDFGHLDSIIMACITDIEMILEEDKDLTGGDNDLLGRICSDLQKKHGFIVRRLK
ncbi:MAG: hypothetical protein J6T10_30050 [Methanobrevibacter sp.]|nr:hypothetical protein [Methanobrevibacter sp.]